MKKSIAVAASALLIAGLAAEAAAHGGYHHGHHRHGGYGYYLGYPLWWGPAYRPYPHYDDYRRSTVIIEREPTVYVQREPMSPVTPAATAPAPLWFYCTDPAGYHPYVNNCNRPWISVDPRTVAAPPGR